MTLRLALLLAAFLMLSLGCANNGELVDLKFRFKPGQFFQFDTETTSESNMQGPYGPTAFRDGWGEGCVLEVMEVDDAGRARFLATVNWVSFSSEIDGELTFYNSREKTRDSSKSGRLMRAIREPNLGIEFEFWLTEDGSVEGLTGYAAALKEAMSKARLPRKMDESEANEWRKVDKTDEDKSTELAQYFLWFPADPVRVGKTVTSKKSGTHLGVPSVEKFRLKRFRDRIANLEILFSFAENPDEVDDGWNFKGTGKRSISFYTETSEFTASESLDIMMGFPSEKPKSGDNSRMVITWSLKLITKSKVKDLEDGRPEP